MNIVNRVRNILERIEGVKSVIYDSYPSANLRLDAPKLPAAVLYLLQGYDIDANRLTKRETAEMQVFFCKKTKLDAKGEEKDATLQEIEPLVMDFIAELNNSPELDINGSVRVETAYGNYDVFVCGLVVRVKLTERQAVCIGETLDRTLVFNDSNPLVYNRNIDVRKYDYIRIELPDIPLIQPR